ncbi:MAG: hypothetical protein Q4C64_01360, partial [Erysipelotrichia bacterium]|nr:hypothetical protein [Erysipelotrichia bacterium]
AEKVYRMIEKYADNDEIDKPTGEVILAVLPTIEDFYKDDEKIIVVKDKIDDYIKKIQIQTTIDNYLNNDQYKEAYDFSYDLDEDHTRAYNCLVKWYNYCLGNESLDQQLTEIKIENRDVAERVFDLVISYLGGKVVPDKEESQFVLQVLRQLDGQFYAGENDFEVLKHSLQYIVDDKKIWTVPQLELISYDKYYSPVHNYSDTDINYLPSDLHVQSGQCGIKLMIHDKNHNVLDEQYIIFGDFSNYNEYSVIGTNYLFDGYWYYYVNRSEPAVYRIGINGQKEQLLSSEDLENRVVYNGFVLDRNVFYTYVKNDDKTVEIYRVYLPDKKIERYKTEAVVDRWFTLLVPQDSNHLKYHCDNPEFVKLVQKVREDKEALYKMISKYFTIDKEKYDSYNMDEIFSWYTGQVYETLDNEYHIPPFCYYEYDIKTKKTTVTPTYDDYRNPYK